MNHNLKKLEYDKILEKLSHFCKTFIGKKIAKELRPLHDVNEVQKNLDETNQGVVLIQRNSCPPIDEIADITFYLKILDGCGTLSIKALIDLKNILQMAENLKKYFAQDFLATSDFSALEYYFNCLYVNQDIVSIMDKSIIDEDTIADSASSKLNQIRKKEKNIEQDIKSKLNSILHSSTYSKYMRENLVTIRSGRFVIPVKEEYRSNIKGFVHDISSSGSTVFIEPLSVFELNNELSNLRIEEEQEIEKILQNLSCLFYPYTNELTNNVNMIGQLDFIFGKARFSIDLNCSTPEINTKKQINFINARHPLIPSDKVVPISVEIGTDFRTLIITGPNTGGKTVTLKTIGLLSAMACSGLNIPVDEHSSFFVFDYIFADIGDEQSISESLSTFSSHMSNIVNITNLATTNSLILVDELGSGTDPLEGANLAISILQYFSELGAITVATSHYQELKQYALVTQNFKNASVEFDIEKLQPTYRLLIGIPGKSNAFAISRKLGLDENIIKRASSMIDKNSIHLEDLLKKIYDTKSELEKEKALTDKYLQEIQELRNKLSAQNKDLEEHKKEFVSKAKQEAKEILLDAKETANSIIKNIQSNSSASEANKLRNNLNKKISDLTDSKKEILVNNPISKDKIKPGLTVYVTNYNCDGIILSNVSKTDDVLVQIGAMKLKIDIKFLQEKNSSSKNKKEYDYSQHSEQLKSKYVSSEINVIGLTVDEAIPLVDKYLDDCFMSKISPVRIVHGKGTGALRNGVHKYLKTNKYVESFRLGTFGEGEMGVTVVNLKL